ncbi:unnamed protein product, partial [Prunus brigantina]
MYIEGINTLFIYASKFATLFEMLPFHALFLPCHALFLF